MFVVTGFAPFNKETINPSWEGVQKLPQQMEGVTLKKLELPVSYQRAFLPLQEMLKKHQDVKGILCVGQAQGRGIMTAEAIAINRRFATISDEDGDSPFHEAVFAQGEAAYFATVKGEKIVEALRKGGVPAKVSYHAGTYVCNSLYNQTLHFLYENKRNIPCVFVHVPFLLGQVLNQQTDVPFMEESTMVKGLEICIKTLLEK